MPRRRPCRADGNGRAQTLGVTGSEGFASRELLAVAHQHIEGVELDLVIVPARAQAVEIPSPVDAKQHRFAVDYERAVPVTQRGFKDQRIAIASVMAVPGEQPHALALALDDQAITVVLDSSGRSGTFAALVGMQGSKGIAVR